MKLKGRNKIPRAISIPTIRDRVVLLALKEYLHEFFSDQVNRKRPNAYVKDIKKYINANKKEKHFVKLDIKTFYDSIDHDILLDMLKGANLDPLAINLVESAIKNPTVPINTRKEEYSKHTPTIGVPQGTSISNILAQVYLQNLDKTIDKRTYFYSRYVDDILLINDEPFSKFRLNNLKKVVNELNLTLHEDKEEQGLLSDSFDFLGYSIQDYNISIANKNVELFIRRIAGKFTWFKNGIERPSTRPKWLLTDNDRYKEVFLEELNESITGIISEDKNYGWLFYFSEMNDQSLLFKIDKIINNFFEQLEPFDYKAPIGLKKLVRTFFAIKHKNNINYISNYSDYDTIRKKRNFLEFRGYIDPENDYKDWEINILFKKYRNKQLRYVESDVGYNYI
ncbi:reverse transcriptase domain-containing protein [uncultured Tenacibaculum sp.]|uniref:reverse transcriptase domain-containing protein n=1 Tax=uncultured Tenacibaculum sp. TaxID=174713 RepID=UPI002631D8BA|nr:reverse transcriptase domain-containing protein [uncultured Tenacibaculum sp.]